MRNFIVVIEMPRAQAMCSLTLECEYPLLLVMLGKLAVLRNRSIRKVVCSE